MHKMYPVVGTVIVRRCTTRGVDVIKVLLGCAPLFALLLASGCAQPDRQASTGEGPNVLVIVADDLGYTDLGAFGGEIETPNLDELARTGIRLTNFHTAASCAPSRSMLMTGTDNHVAGMGSQGNLTTENQRQSPAYQNALLPGVPTIAEHMRDAGYRTMAVAKWHLGSEPEALPGARGFDRSFVLLQGGGGHFDNTPLFGRYGESTWLEDDAPFVLPDDFYSTDFMTDRLIRYIAEDESRPFFAYLGYTAPHWPLQAPTEDISKYADTYETGWDNLREARMAGAIRAGIVPAGAKAVAFEAGMVPWNSLSADERAGAAKRMTVYAAMVDRLDANIGRLFSFLEARGELENTLIVFLSDNGAEAHPIEIIANRNGWVDRTFDNSLDSIGTRRSYTTLGPGWARATAAPFRASKSKVSEGGIRTPAIVRLPGGANGSIDDSYMRIMDLAPTFLEAAGRGVPAAMMGRSQLRRLKGGRPVYTPEDFIAFEVYGRRGVQQGNFKALLQEPPYGTGEWQLYNLARDQGEQSDLAIRHPDRLGRLIDAWQSYADKVGVILPESPISY
jgi:arylsulfatase